mmetsp:Transcript_4380/g.10593  ORF Transcript_4380/g.10593 Transcript_4380/m.10593 type:complete len:250 (-) Transcript_4380:115-864(-)
MHRIRVGEGDREGLPDLRRARSRAEARDLLLHRLPRPTTQPPVHYGLRDPPQVHHHERGLADVGEDGPLHVHHLRDEGRDAETPGGQVHRDKRSSIPDNTGGGGGWHRRHGHPHEPKRPRDDREGDTDNHGEERAGQISRTAGTDPVVRLVSGGFKQLRQEQDHRHHRQPQQQLPPPPQRLLPVLAGQQHPEHHVGVHQHAPHVHDVVQQVQGGAGEVGHGPGGHHDPPGGLHHGATGRGQGQGGELPV